MWSYMETKKPSVFVKNYDEGVARVKRVRNYILSKYQKFPIPN